MSLRWGIVSAGKISHDFVNALNSYPERSKGNDVVGTAARDPEKAKEFAKLHNIKHVFESYQAMAMSKDIDVAYIGALNPQHFELTKLFLENGKHVLCEKPLCLNEKQTRVLIDLARNKNLFLMEAVWSRFFPTYEALEKYIQSGKLGDVLYVEVNFGVPIATVDRVSQKELGGSAILDIGVYVLQFAQFVFNDAPIKVTAIGELNSEGVDVVNTVVLEYENGRRAVLNVHAKVKLWNKATVVGTKGRITAGCGMGDCFIQRGYTIINTATSSLLVRLPPNTIGEMSMDYPSAADPEAVYSVLGSHMAPVMLNEPFHAPTEVVYPDGSIEKFPIHTSKIPYNFENSAGLAYEAEEAKRCIEKGLLESPRMPHSESILLARLEDEIRKQVGVHFAADDQHFS